MKTNASVKTIKKAIETVSKNYDNNVILLREPENTTKHVVRFVVKVKDREKAGAFVLSNGVKTSKANESVQLDVIDQIFQLESKPHLYVDTHVGRIYKEDREKQKETQKIETPIETKSEPVETKNELSHENLLKLSKPYEKVTKRKYNSRKNRLAIENKNSRETVERVMKALNYILNHEEILKQVE